MLEQICFIKPLLVLGKHKLHQFCNLSFMLYLWEENKPPLKLYLGNIL